MFPGGDIAPAVRDHCVRARWPFVQIRIAPKLLLALRFRQDPAQSFRALDFPIYSECPRSLRLSQGQIAQCSHAQRFH